MGRTVTPPQDPLALDVGDIVLVAFPFSSGQAAKKRPALVMSRRDAYGDVLLLAITSNPATPDGIPITTADLTNGRLDLASWIKPEKVNAVDSARIQRVLGRARPYVLSQVRARLCPLLGCV